jgi:hypothetical protein
MGRPQTSNEHASWSVQSTNGTTTPWETPAIYSLDGAMDRAFHENFDTRIQFEHVIQARLSARASYLNLLPHLSLSSVLSVFIPSVTGILGAIGDLAPFLLPTRWYQAREAALMSKSERQSLALMRMDAAAQVEGLAYALDRDRSILEQYSAFLSQAFQVRDSIQKLELANQLPEGSTDHLKAMINSMSLDMSALRLIVTQDRAVLAQAMGFFNPSAVADLTLGSEALPIDQAVPLDTQPTTRQAIARAYELVQMDYLIQISGLQKRELYFNWLDPAGDYRAALGFGLGSLVAVGRSRIHELQIKREQLAAAVAQKIAEAVGEYDQALESYRLAQEGVEIQKVRLARVISQVTPNSSLNTMDVAGIFQDSLGSAIRLRTVLTSFRVARSRIDRALLHGHYLQLPQPNRMALGLL